METITLDFETYFSSDYTLRKMTTTEYLMDDQFEVILVAIKRGGKATEWVSGRGRQLESLFNDINWQDVILLAHNAAFDAAILKWHYGKQARITVCTEGLSRAVDTRERRHSLEALGERYEIGRKGTATDDYRGVRLADFSDSDLRTYGEYAKNDVEMTYKLFKIFSPQVSPEELLINSLTTGMFIKEQRCKAVSDSGLDLKTLRSRQKFSAYLEDNGVPVPMKISLTTNEPTEAFAKTDRAFLKLKEHPKVGAAVKAKLLAGSSIALTRGERLLSISKTKKLLPVPLRYSGAHTHRWSGKDKINLQNLPSRGTDAKILKRCLRAPKGHQIVEADLRQIEPRVLCFLSEHETLLKAFEQGEDTYSLVAAEVFGVDLGEVTKEQRAVGKMCVLSLGYGMGATKFMILFYL